MKRGTLITFEGPEGSGKSTQIRRLSRWLKGRGNSVLMTREPGGTKLGQKIRNLLLDPKNGPIDPVVELCLYEASRLVLLREKIAPALKAGKVVLVDRFQDSTWVYQGWAGGVDLSLVERMGKAVLGNLQPALTILLDLPVRTGLKRVRRPNRIEAKALSFHEKVRQGFRVLARKHPRRFRLISAVLPPAAVQRKIQEIVKGVLNVLE